jgi:hypothetical protein
VSLSTIRRSRQAGAPLCRAANRQRQSSCVAGLILLLQRCAERNSIILKFDYFDFDILHILLLLCRARTPPEPPEPVD